MARFDFVRVPDIFHPTLTAADIATMSPHERAYFTDEPVAHRCAQIDFERSRRIEARDRITADNFIAFSQAARVALMLLDAR